MPEDDDYDWMTEKKREQAWKLAKKKEFQRLLSLCQEACEKARKIPDTMYDGMRNCARRETNDLLWSEFTDPWLVERRRRFDVEIAESMAKIWIEHRAMFLSWINKNCERF